MDENVLVNARIKTCRALYVHIQYIPYIYMIMLLFELFAQTVPCWRPRHLLVRPVLVVQLSMFVWSSA